MAAGPKMSDSLFGYVHFGGRTVAWTTYGVLGAAENTRVPWLNSDKELNYLSTVS